MTVLALTQSQQSAACLPGTWRLDGARAVTLRPREDGLLRIAHGQVWVTFDGPHAGPPNELGDFVLGAGQQLRVRAGRRVVMESTDPAAAAYFSWDFSLQPEPVRLPRMQAVAQSWCDLQLALALAVRASWRLAKALGTLGAGALLPRPQEGCRRALT